MIKEFREFIERGNVVDLAVAVVIGAAFGAVVTSFTDDILMQIVAAIFSQPDFSNLEITLNGSSIRYGAFINAVISFLIIAFSVFIVVKAINALRRDPEPDDGDDDESELAVLKQIRDSLELRN